MVGKSIAYLLFFRNAKFNSLHEHAELLPTALSSQCDASARAIQLCGKPGGAWAAALPDRLQWRAAATGFAIE
jgi:hypothetical protein